MMGYDGTWRAQRFYRDPRQGKLMGVCAGVAEYFGCNVTLIRILVIIALFWFGALTLVAYLILGFLFPTKPDTLHDWDTGEEYLPSVGRSAGGTFRDVRHRCRALDMKLQHMEGYVTSSRHDLDRQFRDLEH
jgi:phage shock protein C